MRGFLKGADSSHGVPGALPAAPRHPLRQDPEAQRRLRREVEAWIHIMARDLDRHRAVAWVPFLGTWLQFLRAVHGLWIGDLAPSVATSQIVWEGTFGALGLVGYRGAYRRPG